MAKLSKNLERIARELCFKARTLQEINEEQFQAAIEKTKETMFRAAEFADNYRISSSDEYMFDDAHLKSLESAMAKAMARAEGKSPEEIAIEVERLIELRLEFSKYHTEAKANYLRLANLSRNFHADLTGMTVRSARMFDISGASRITGISPSDRADADNFVMTCDLVVYYLDSISPELKKLADTAITRSSLSECLRSYNIKINALLANGIKPKDIVKAGRRAYESLKSAERLEKARSQYELQVELPAGDAEKYGGDY